MYDSFKILNNKIFITIFLMSNSRAILLSSGRSIANWASPYAGLSSRIIDFPVDPKSILYLKKFWDQLDFEVG